MNYFISEITDSVFRNNNGQIEYKPLDRPMMFSDESSLDEGYWSPVDEELVGNEELSNGQTLSEHYRVIEELIGGKV